MTYRPLPGDLTQEDMVRRMIRVNHAGEYGALRIYAGQMDALKGTASDGVMAELEGMKASEQRHFDGFESMGRARHIRPTRLEPLWHVLGYGLGYVTGKMGVEAAMACTVAVEEVIVDHYKDQERHLQTFDGEADLYRFVQTCRMEEDAHRTSGLDHGAADAPLFPILTGAVRRLSKIAIWLSTRV